MNKDQEFYSNIQGNSKHNSEHDYKHEHDKEDEGYADEYDYHNYMEKKVHKMVRDGSQYLEGLRRSLENYTDFLESCDQRNSSVNSTSNSTWSPPYYPPGSSSPNVTGPTPILNYQNYDSVDIPMKSRNSPEMPRPKPGSRQRPGRRMSCDEANEAREQVRRYADLAMWATKRLQDIAYAKKYQKTDDKEEDELILKLAWFLDRLAYLTGYEPDYKMEEPRRATSTSTPIPTAMTLVPASEEQKQEMMDCLQRNSSEPATVRCRYTGQIPDVVAQMMSGGTTQSTPTRASRSNGVIPLDQSELLITADSSPLTRKLITKRSTEYTTFYYPTKPLHESAYPVPIVKIIKNRLSNIKAIVKSIVEKRIAHIVEKNEVKKHFDKRSIDDASASSNDIKQINAPKNEKSIKKLPLNEYAVLTHYPVSDVSVVNTKSFKKRHKRTLFKKNVIHVHTNKPVHVVRPHIHKKDHKPKLLTTLHKLHELKKKAEKKVHKVIKRSLHYEDMYLPRIPTNPQGDISYYVKNKEGTNYNPSLVQAAQVRLGLEQIFQTGNIEVVHRFGANYNPLVPAPFYAGIIATNADV
ncbi:unnamed protein product [Chrysodeixis includens]|uniref:Uncharacterized protein n=1 Tax=Chrysodeixis includens TaxID=689277 RepID=A0A9N8L524_CHRIL|nr:unnamed protein product [Chrysodeixis includens]